jgi:DDE family transposase
VRLQAFADAGGVTIPVTPYPTGAAKWNPSAHRMLNLISATWSGQPLESDETLRNHLPLAQPRAFRAWHGLIPNTLPQGRQPQKKTAPVSACERIVSSHTGTIRFSLASSSNLQLDQLMFLQLLTLLGSSVSVAGV